MAKASEAVNAAVSSIRVVRSFNAEKQEARRYSNLLKEMNALKVRRDAATAVSLIGQRVSLTPPRTAEEPYPGP